MHRIATVGSQNRYMGECNSFITVGMASVALAWCLVLGSGY
ncbi:MAG: hypothetical protein OQL16_00615 [Gammaproteobacteria bacterium]|nr:hypothetical protein [Gammaproteobacteria bacterium]